MTDKDLTGKRIYFDSETLEKLRLLATRHRGNESETVREAVRVYYGKVKDQMEAIKKALEEK